MWPHQRSKTLQPQQTETGQNRSHQYELQSRCVDWSWSNIVVLLNLNITICLVQHEQQNLPRYTFLQDIFNFKLLFCIFWDIKNNYIKEVIYCSLINWYTKTLYALIWNVLIHAGECVFVKYINCPHPQPFVFFTFAKRSWSWTVAYWCSRRECLNVSMSEPNLGLKTLKCFLINWRSLRAMSLN